MYPMRSLMYVPGNRQRMVDRALAVGELTAGPLDVAMLDLEDGTPFAEKAAARAIIATSLGQPSKGGRGPVRWVRINALNGPWVAEDLAAAVRPGVEGLVVPKVDDPEGFGAFARDLDARERAAGLAPGTVALVPMIEGALGLMEAYQIGISSPRVIALMFGVEDYALDLGLPGLRVAEAAELIYARSALVNASVAARVAPLDSAWPDFHDPEGLRRDSLLARRLGFAGKSLISPGQLEIINEVFSPSAAEIERARQVVRTFDEGEARGIGAVVFEGAMIDRPIVERARRTLRLAGG